MKLKLRSALTSDKIARVSISKDGGISWSHCAYIIQTARTYEVKPVWVAKFGTFGSEWTSEALVLLAKMVDSYNGVKG